MTDWDVLIIGAGSAGLNALREVRKQTDRVRLFHDGPYGTTCARIGCMPSKVLLQTAKDYHRRHVLAGRGIDGAAGLRVDVPRVLRHVRALRDRFVRAVLGGMEANRQFITDGRARFVARDTLEVDGERHRGRRIVIATGSRPIVPDRWREAFGDRLLTSDEIFELEDLPQRIAVVGLGVIGLELGQALAFLDREVSGFEALPLIGGLSDPAVNQAALEHVAGAMKLGIGAPAELAATADGRSLVVSGGGLAEEVDRVLVSLGRRPNVDGLGLEALGLPLDERGVPAHDPTTMQVDGAPIFIAGDASGERAVLHEAADEGRIAGFNAARETPERFVRRTPLAIAFCEPNLAFVGTRFGDLPDDVVVGEVSYDGQGRALTMDRNGGLLRVYGEPQSGLLLGAEMAAPDGEHLAHLLCWMIQERKTVHQLLQLPYYHPVIEEGLRTALRELAAKVRARPAVDELRLAGELGSATVGVSASAAICNE